VRRSGKLTAEMSGQQAYDLHEQRGRFDGECGSTRKNIRCAHGAPKAHLLLVMQKTRLDESLSHLSVASSGHLILPDFGPFAQPIEMGVHSWNPSFIPYGQSCGAL
jgi:hypothetical protein